MFKVDNLLFSFRPLGHKAGFVRNPEVREPLDEIKGSPRHPGSGTAIRCRRDPCPDRCRPARRSKRSAKAGFPIFVSIIVPILVDEDQDEDRDDDEDGRRSRQGLRRRSSCLGLPRPLIISYAEDFL